MVDRPTGATKSQEADLEFRAGGVIMQIVIRFASQHAVYIIFYHGDQFVGSTRLVIALAVRGRSASLGMASAALFDRDHRSIQMTPEQSLEREICELTNKRNHIITSCAKNADAYDDYLKVTNQILQAERQLARLRGDEVAQPIEWSEPWTTSSRVIHFFGFGLCAVFFYDQCRRSNATLPLVIYVKLVNPYVVTSGGPNDEVIEGQSLYGKGIATCSAFLIENSKWKEEQEKVNRHHRLFCQSRWQRINHYLWTFHDTQIQALAEGFEIQLRDGQLEDVALEELTQLLINPARSNNPDGKTDNAG